MITVTIKLDEFGFLVLEEDGFTWAVPTLAKALTEAIEILNEG